MEDLRERDRASEPHILSRLLLLERDLSNQTRRDCADLRTLTDVYSQQPQSVRLHGTFQDLSQMLSRMVCTYARSISLSYISSTRPLLSLDNMDVGDYATALSRTALLLMLDGCQQCLTTTTTPQTYISSLGSHAEVQSREIVANILQNALSLPQSLTLSIIAHLATDLLHTPLSTLSQYTNIPAYIVDVSLFLSMELKSESSTTSSSNDAVALPSALTPSPAFLTSVLTIMSQSLYSASFSAIMDICKDDEASCCSHISHTSSHTSHTHTQSLLTSLFAQQGILQTHYERHLAHQHQTHKSSLHKQSPLQNLLSELKQHAPTLTKLKKNTAIQTGHIPGSLQGKSRSRPPKRPMFPITSSVDLNIVINELIAHSFQHQHQQHRDQYNGHAMDTTGMRAACPMNARSLYTSQLQRVCIDQMNTTSPYSNSLPTTMASSSSSYIDPSCLSTSQSPHHRYGTHAIPASHMHTYMRKVHYVHQLYRGYARHMEIDEIIENAKKRRDNGTSAGVNPGVAGAMRTEAEENKAKEQQNTRKDKPGKDRKRVVMVDDDDEIDGEHQAETQVKKAFEGEKAGKFEEGKKATRNRDSYSGKKTPSRKKSRPVVSPVVRVWTNTRTRDQCTDLVPQNTLFSTSSDVPNRGVYGDMPTFAPRDGGDSAKSTCAIEGASTVNGRTTSHDSRNGAVDQDGNIGNHGYNGGVEEGKEDNREDRNEEEQNENKQRVQQYMRVVEDILPSIRRCKHIQEEKTWREIEFSEICSVFPNSQFSSQPDSGTVPEADMNSAVFSSFPSSDLSTSSSSLTPSPVSLDTQLQYALYYTWCNALQCMLARTHADIYPDFHTTIPAFSSSGSCSSSIPISKFSMLKTHDIPSFSAVKQWTIQQMLTWNSLTHSSSSFSSASATHAATDARDLAKAPAHIHTPPATIAPTIHWPYGMWWRFNIVDTRSFTGDISISPAGSSHSFAPTSTSSPSGSSLPLCSSSSCASSSLASPTLSSFTHTRIHPYQDTHVRQHQREYPHRGHDAHAMPALEADNDTTTTITTIATTTSATVPSSGNLIADANPDPADTNVVAKMSDGIDHMSPVGITIPGKTELSQIHHFSELPPENARLSDPSLSYTSKSSHKPIQKKLVFHLVPCSCHDMVDIPSSSSSQPHSPSASSSAFAVSPSLCTDISVCAHPIAMYNRSIMHRYSILHAINRVITHAYTLNTLNPLNDIAKNHASICEKENGETPKFRNISENSVSKHLHEVCIEALIAQCILHEQKKVLRGQNSLPNPENVAVSLENTCIPSQNCVLENVLLNIWLFTPETAAFTLACLKRNYAHSLNRIYVTHLILSCLKSLIKVTFANATYGNVQRSIQRDIPQYTQQSTDVFASSFLDTVNSSYGEIFPAMYATLACMGPLLPLAVLPSTAATSTSVPTPVSCSTVASAPVSPVTASTTSPACISVHDIAAIYASLPPLLPSPPTITLRASSPGSCRTPPSTCSSAAPSAVASSSWCSSLRFSASLPHISVTATSATSAPLSISAQASTSVHHHHLLKLSSMLQVLIKWTYPALFSAFITFAPPKSRRNEEKYQYPTLSHIFSGDSGTKGPEKYFPTHPHVLSCLFSLFLRLCILAEKLTYMQNSSFSADISGKTTKNLEFAFPQPLFPVRTLLMATSLATRAIHTLSTPQHFSSLLTYPPSAVISSAFFSPTSPSPHATASSCSRQSISSSCSSLPPSSSVYAANTAIASALSHLTLRAAIAILRTHTHPSFPIPATSVPNSTSMPSASPPIYTSASSMISNAPMILLRNLLSCTSAFTALPTPTSAASTSNATPASSSSAASSSFSCSQSTSSVSAPASALNDLHTHTTLLFPSLFDACPEVYVYPPIRHTNIHIAQWMPISAISGVVTSSPEGKARKTGNYGKPRRKCTSSSGVLCFRYQQDYISRLRRYLQSFPSLAPLFPALSAIKTEKQHDHTLSTSHTMQASGNVAFVPNNSHNSRPMTLTPSSRPATTPPGSGKKGKIGKNVPVKRDPVPMSNLWCFWDQNLYVSSLLQRTCIKRNQLSCHYEDMQQTDTGSMSDTTGTSTDMYMDDHGNFTDTQHVNEYLCILPSCFSPIPINCHTTTTNTNTDSTTTHININSDGTELSTSTHHPHSQVVPQQQWTLAPLPVEMRPALMPLCLILPWNGPDTHANPGSNSDPATTSTTATNTTALTTTISNTNSTDMSVPSLIPTTNSTNTTSLPLLPLSSSSSCPSPSPPLPSCPSPYPSPAPSASSPHTSLHPHLAPAKVLLALRKNLFPSVPVPFSVFSCIEQATLAEMIHIHNHNVANTIKNACLDILGKNKQSVNESSDASLGNMDKIPNTKQIPISMDDETTTDAETEDEEENDDNVGISSHNDLPRAMSNVTTSNIDFSTICIPLSCLSTIIQAATDANIAGDDKRLPSSVQFSSSSPFPLTASTLGASQTHFSSAYFLFSRNNSHNTGKIPDNSTPDSSNHSGNCEFPQKSLSISPTIDPITPTIARSPSHVAKSQPTTPRSTPRSTQNTPKTTGNSANNAKTSSKNNVNDKSGKNNRGVPTSPSSGKKSPKNPLSALFRELEFAIEQGKHPVGPVISLHALLSCLFSTAERESTTIHRGTTMLHTIPTFAPTSTSATSAHGCTSTTDVGDSAGAATVGAIGAVSAVIPPYSDNTEESASKISTTIHKIFNPFAGALMYSDLSISKGFHAPLPPRSQDSDTSTENTILQDMGNDENALLQILSTYTESLLAPIILANSASLPETYRCSSPYVEPPMSMPIGHDVEELHGVTVHRTGDHDCGDDDTYDDHGCGTNDDNNRNNDNNDNRNDGLCVNMGDSVPAECVAALSLPAVRHVLATITSMAQKHVDIVMATTQRLSNMSRFGDEKSDLETNIETTSQSALVLSRMLHLFLELALSLAPWAGKVKGLVNKHILTLGSRASAAYEEGTMQKKTHIEARCGSSSHVTSVNEHNMPTTENIHGCMANTATIAATATTTTAATDGVTSTARNLSKDTEIFTSSVNPYSCLDTTLHESTDYFPFTDDFVASDVLKDIFSKLRKNMSFIDTFEGNLWNYDEVQHVNTRKSTSSSHLTPRSLLMDDSNIDAVPSNTTDPVMALKIWLLNALPRYIHEKSYSGLTTVFTEAYNAFSTTYEEISEEIRVGCIMLISQLSSILEEYQHTLYHYSPRMAPATSATSCSSLSALPLPAFLLSCPHTSQFLYQARELSSLVCSTIATDAFALHRREAAFKQTMSSVKDSHGDVCTTSSDAHVDDMSKQHTSSSFAALYPLVLQPRLSTPSAHPLGCLAASLHAELSAPLSAQLLVLLSQLLRHELASTMAVPSLVLFIKCLRHVFATVKFTVEDIYSSSLMCTNINTNTSNINISTNTSTNISTIKAAIQCVQLSLSTMYKCFCEFPIDITAISVEITAFLTETQDWLMCKDPAYVSIPIPNSKTSLKNPNDSSVPDVDVFPAVEKPQNSYIYPVNTTQIRELQWIQDSFMPILSPKVPIDAQLAWYTPFFTKMCSSMLLPVYPLAVSIFYSLVQVEKLPYCRPPLLHITGKRHFSQKHGFSEGIAAHVSLTHLHTSSSFAGQPPSRPHSQPNHQLYDPHSRTHHLKTSYRDTTPEHAYFPSSRALTLRHATQLYYRNTPMSTKTLTLRDKLHQLIDVLSVCETHVKMLCDAPSVYTLKQAPVEVTSTATTVGTTSPIAKTSLPLSAPGIATDTLPTDTNTSVDTPMNRGVNQQNACDSALFEDGISATTLPNATSSVTLSNVVPANALPDVVMRDMTISDATMCDSITPKATVSEEIASPAPSPSCSWSSFSPACSSWSSTSASLRLHPLPSKTSHDMCWTLTAHIAKTGIEVAVWSIFALTNVFSLQQKTIPEFPKVLGNLAHIADRGCVPGASTPVLSSLCSTSSATICSSSLPSSLSQSPSSSQLNSSLRWPLRIIDRTTVPHWLPQPPLKADSLERVRNSSKNPSFPQYLGISGINGGLSISTERNKLDQYYSSLVWPHTMDYKRNKQSKEENLISSAAFAFLSGQESGNIVENGSEFKKNPTNTKMIVSLDDFDGLMSRKRPHSGKELDQDARKKQDLQQQRYEEEEEEDMDSEDEILEMMQELNKNRMQFFEGFYEKYEQRTPKLPYTQKRPTSTTPSTSKDEQNTLNLRIEVDDAACETPRKRARRATTPNNEAKKSANTGATHVSTSTSTSTSTCGSKSTAGARSPKTPRTPTCSSTQSHTRCETPAESYVCLSAAMSTTPKPIPTVQRIPSLSSTQTPSVSTQPHTLSSVPNSPSTACPTGALNDHNNTHPTPSPHGMGGNNAISSATIGKNGLFFSESKSRATSRATKAISSSFSLLNTMIKKIHQGVSLHHLGISTVPESVFTVVISGGRALCDAVECIYLATVNGCTNQCFSYIPDYPEFVSSGKHGKMGNSELSYFQPYSTSSASVLSLLSSPSHSTDPTGIVADLSLMSNSSSTPTTPCSTPSAFTASPTAASTAASTSASASVSVLASTSTSVSSQRRPSAMLLPPSQLPAPKPSPVLALWLHRLCTIATQMMELHASVTQALNMLQNNRENKENGDFRGDWETIHDTETCPHHFPPGMASPSYFSAPVSCAVNAFGVVYGVSLCNACTSSLSGSTDAIICLSCTQQGLEGLYTRVSLLLDHIISFLATTADKHRVKIHSSLISYAQSRVKELSAYVSTSTYTSTQPQPSPRVKRQSTSVTTFTSTSASTSASTSTSMDLSWVHIQNIYTSLQSLCSSAKRITPKSTRKQPSSSSKPVKKATNKKTRGNVFGAGVLGQWLEEEYKGKRNVVFDGYEDLDGFIASDEE